MTPQDILSPGGAAARELAALGWTALITCCVTIAVMWILLGVIAGKRRRGTFEEHAPVDEGAGQGWILTGGFLVPLLVLGLLFGAALGALAHFPVGGEARGSPQIHVTGRQWWFEGRYLSENPGELLTVPNEMHIPAGANVDIELETADVIHSFWVPRLHGKVDLVPGQTNHIRVRADAPGVYEGECAEFCGMQHAHMRVKLIADTPQQFRQWLAAQRAPAKDPATPDAARGREIFLSSACALCHTVRGTTARATVGPDLTHVASRSTIAGGAAPNDPAHLLEWVTHAQALKPGARMPDMTQLSAEDARLIVAYLQTLT